MYLPTVLTKNAPLTPSAEEARKQGFFGRAKSILRSNTRQMTRQLAKEEERIQGEKFLSKLQEETRVIGVQSFQGFSGGHILHQKK
jgi:hypothetical protein